MNEAARKTRMESLKLRIDALEAAECYVIEILGMTASFLCDEQVMMMHECGRYTFSFLEYVPKMYMKRLDDLKSELKQLEEEDSKNRILE